MTKRVFWQCGHSLFFDELLHFALICCAPARVSFSSLRLVGSLFTTQATRLRTLLLVKERCSSGGARVFMDDDSW